GGRLVDELAPAPPEEQAGGVADVPVAAEEALALYERQGAQARPVPGVDLQQGWVVVEPCRDEREAERILGLHGRVLLEELLAGARPDQLVADSREPPDDAGALGDGQAVRTDPPIDELPDPTV